MSFFFVLSGFILTYVYAPLDAHRIPRFLVARIARIWPMYVVAFLIPFFTLAVAVYPGAHHPGPILVNLALLQSWTIHPPPSVNGVSWSLSVELFFYLAFPGLLWCWSRKPAITMGVIALVGIALVLATDRALGSDTRSLQFGFVSFNPIVRLMEFALGIATAHLWRWLRPRLKISRTQGTIVEAATLAVVALVMYGSAGWSERLTRTHWNALTAQWEDGAGYHRWFGHAMPWWLRSSGFTMLPFAALILVMALAPGWISRLFALRACVVLGEISYSVYLLHDPLYVYWVVHRNAVGWIPSGMRYAVYWAAVLLVSLVGRLVIERPCRQAILHMWDRWRRTRAVSTTTSGAPPHPPLSSAESR